MNSFTSMTERLDGMIVELRNLSSKKEFKPEDLELFELNMVKLESILKNIKKNNGDYNKLADMSMGDMHSYINLMYSFIALFVNIQRFVE